MVVFLATGLAGRVAASTMGRVAVSAVGCVSGVALMLLTQRHLQVVDVFAQVSGYFAVNDAFKLQARNLVQLNAERIFGHVIGVFAGIRDLLSKVWLHLVRAQVVRQQVGGLSGARAVLIVDVDAAPDGLNC